MTTQRTVPGGWREWVSLLARLILAGVWLYAGFSKVGNLEANVISVEAYQILPAALERLIGYTLPMIEIVLGVLLLLGLFIRIDAILSGLLMIVFIAGIASAWARGLALDCGCFGEGGVLPAGEEPTYLQEILRDIGFLALAVWLTIFPGSRWALDNWLFGTSSTDYDDAELEVSEYDDATR